MPVGRGVLVTVKASVGGVTTACVVFPGKQALSRPVQNKMTAGIRQIRIR